MNQLILANDDMAFLKYTNLMGEPNYLCFLNLLIDLLNEPDFIYVEEEIEDFEVMMQLKEVPSAFSVSMAAMHYYKELYFDYSIRRKDAIFHSQIIEDIEEFGEEEALERHVDNIADILSQNAGGGLYGAAVHDGTEIDLCLDVVRLLNRFNYCYFMDDKEEGSFAGDFGTLQLKTLVNSPVKEVW